MQNMIPHQNYSKYANTGGIMGNEEIQDVGKFS